jgi:two-component system response regulator
MKTPVVLCVDDSFDDRVLFTQACEQAKASFRLYWAEQGQDAIDYLSAARHYADRAQFPIPDGVVLDLKMPVLDGFGVLHWIREQQHFLHLPVFILTSSYQHTDIARAYSGKATAFLTKPSEFRSLICLAAALHECFLPDRVETEPLKKLTQYKRP